MCSGVGTTMAFIVGISTLWRRGWRVAAFHTAAAGRRLPDVRRGGASRPQHIREASGRRPLGLGQERGVEWVRVAGPLHDRRCRSRRSTRRRHRGRDQDNSVAKLRRRATPTAALFLGGIVFALTTGYGRWGLGTEGATASRYVYLAAAFTLPAIVLRGRGHHETLERQFCAARDPAALAHPMERVHVRHRRLRRRFLPVRKAHLDDGAPCAVRFRCSARRPPDQRSLLGRCHDRLPARRPT